MSDVRETTPTQPPGDEGAEYVYEDEAGNRIEPPPEGLNPDEYEVVEAEPAAAAQAAPEPPAGAAAPVLAGGPAPKPTRDAAAPRRAGSQKPSRVSARPAPTGKRSRVKAYLLLGLAFTIIALLIAIAVVLWIRFHHKPAPQAPRVELNDFDKGKKLKEDTALLYDRAEDLFRQGKNAEAEDLYKKCSENFEQARKLMISCHEKNPGDQFAYMEDSANKIIQLIKNCNDRAFMLEMRRLREQRPAPPPPPPTPEAPPEEPAPPPAEPPVEPPAANP